MFEMCFIEDKKHTDAGTAIYGKISSARHFCSVVLTIRVIQAVYVNAGRTLGLVSNQRGQMEKQAWMDWVFTYTCQCDEDVKYNLECAFTGMNASIQNMLSRRM